MIRVLFIALSVASSVWFSGCGGSTSAKEKPSAETQQAPAQEQSPAQEQAPAQEQPPAQEAEE